jgi:YD repeat-containing protein
MSSSKSLYLSMVVFCIAVMGMGLYLMRPSSGPVSAASPGFVTYNYDSLGRVIEDVAAGGNSGAYSYDSAGNRTAASLN